MIPELDIYRSVNVLIREHGKDGRMQDNSAACGRAPDADRMSAFG